MRKNKSAFGVLTMKVRPIIGDIAKYAQVLISPSGVPVIPCTNLENTPKSEVRPNSIALQHTNCNFSTSES